MSYWVCCNSCFLCPSPERKLAVTSCGHVICSVCYQKGSHGRCLICSSQCQVSPLSDKSSSDVKALFSDIGVMATRHLTEISKVVAFQARHQKRLLNYYKQKNHKLEDMLVTIKQEMQQMGKKLNDQRAYIAKLEKSLQHHSLKAPSQIGSSPHTPHGNKSVLQIPYESPVFLPRHASATNILWLKEAVMTAAWRSAAELMKCAFLCGSSQSLELEERSLFRKPVSAPRLSVMKALPEGRPGPATHWSYSQNPLTSHSAHSATVSRFSPSTPESYGQSSAWKSPQFKASSSFSHSASFLGFPPP
ncbi:putative E3 SUMO-protein ligase RNF212 isoform X2 [Xiphophorus couchianus]|uniref:putative E3 SUMO-protein ligase RNF212 isoform X2 n=1 Tax=Xiphophorus couchianus TaxID=32473 RepID=UPI00101602F8|nr:probable E3 SUMO-protein ligase RNF212 isoform X2 [Xiphophorus couchianus]